MTTTKWTKEQVNKAIYTVLTTKFKKESPEAFNIVKAAGYDYCKNGTGMFEVYNPSTSRRIYLTKGGYYGHYHTDIHAGAYSRYTTVFEGPDCDLDAEEKFDYVGCLDKPINETWCHMRNHEDDISQAVQRYNNLVSKKRYVRYKEEEIERIQRQMENLQKDLMKAMEYKVQYEQDVKNYKKELGLA